MAKTVAKARKIHKYQRASPPIVIRTMSKMLALSRKSKPRAGVLLREYTVKVAKYLPYTYTLSLRIIAGHNQTICTDLNKPSAGFGKEKHPSASIPASFFISLQQVCTKLLPNSNYIQLKTAYLSVSLEIPASSEPTL